MAEKKWEDLTSEEKEEQGLIPWIQLHKLDRLGKEFIAKLPKGALENCFLQICELKDGFLYICRVKDYDADSGKYELGYKDKDLPPRKVGAHNLHGSRYFSRRDELIDWAKEHGLYNHK